MNILAWLITPILGGLIALSTNWLAVKMLFRPHQEKRLFCMRLPFTPGLIPREKTRLAKKLAEAISARLLTPEVLAEGLSDPALWPWPQGTIGEHLAKWGINDPAAQTSHLLQQVCAANREPIKQMADALLPMAIGFVRDFNEHHPDLDEKLSELVEQIANASISSLARLFVKRGTIYTNIKNGVVTYLSAPENQDFIREKIHHMIDNFDQVDLTRFLQAVSDRVCTFSLGEGLGAFFRNEYNAAMLRRVMTVVSGYVAAHMPIQAMIERKINDFDVAEAESVILSVVDRELRMIIWLGGVLGFLIGLLALLV